MPEIDLTSTDRLWFPRSQIGSEPQHLLSVLLGDYWFARTEHIPSSALVMLLGEFGISEPSARQAILRLHKRGLLVQSKNGRETAYGFQPRSNKVTMERLRRVVGFGASSPRWDSSWTVVTFSMPEHSRVLRGTLRKRLRNLGFTVLQDAIWICPRDETKAAGAVLDELEVRDGHVFRATSVPRAEPEASLAAAYDLDDLRERYVAFTEKHQPVAHGRKTVDNALVYRSNLMNEWLAFRTDDPELPAELLPEDWPRPRAYRTFIAIYDALGPKGEADFRRIIARVDPDLARLTSHHTSALL